MHTAFSLEISESIVTLHLHSHRLDSCILTLEFIRNSNFVSVALSPTDIHTHQHCRPVIRFRSSCSGIYGKYSSEIVTFLSKHIAELQGLEFCHYGTIGCIDLIILEFEQYIEVLHP